MDIGKVERINRSDVWSNSRAFTSWLRGNIQQLSEILSIPLEEKPELLTGNILTYQTEKGVVLIISQLEEANIEEVIINAAQVEARAIIWIAEQFPPEYISAIVWSGNIIAVRLEVWKIGDSPVAPKFEIVGPIVESTKETGKPSEKRERVSDELKWTPLSRQEDRQF